MPKKLPNVIVDASESNVAVGMLNLYRLRNWLCGAKKVSPKLKLAGAFCAEKSVDVAIACPDNASKHDNPRTIFRVEIDNIEFMIVLYGRFPIA